MGPVIEPRDDHTTPRTSTPGWILERAAIGWVSTWEGKNRNMRLSPNDWQMMVDDTKEFLGWRGWSQREDFQERFVMDRMSDFYHSSINTSSIRRIPRSAFPSSVIDGPAELEPQSLFLPGFPHSPGSDCPDMFGLIGFREGSFEDEFGFRRTSREGERMDRFVASFTAGVNRPGDEAARDVDEGEEHDVEDEEEEDEEEEIVMEEDVVVSPEEDMIRAGQIAQARRSQRQSDESALVELPLTEVRRIVAHPGESDLISPEARRGVTRQLINMIRPSEGAEVDEDVSSRLTEMGESMMDIEPTLSADDLFRTLNLMYEMLPVAEIDGARHAGIPYISFLMRARIRQEESDRGVLEARNRRLGLDSEPRSEQRWGGEFTRQSLPGMMDEEEDVDSDGEPMVTWTRTGPTAATPLYRPEVTGAGTAQPVYARESRWNYSTTMAPIVAARPPSLSIPWGKYEDENDMFGLATCGYSSNRVQQYRMASTASGSSGSSSTQVPEAMRYRETLGRHARSREIVFGMSEAADRFESALQGVLCEVQGPAGLTSGPSAATSSASGMNERSREFAEVTSRTRSSTRVRQEKEGEVERGQGRRSESLSAGEATHSTQFTYLDGPENKKRSVDAADDVNVVFWLSTSQHEATLAMQRLLQKRSQGPRIFVPLRRGESVEPEYQRKIWEEVSLEDILHAGMHSIGEKLRDIILGPTRTYPASQEINAMWLRAADSATRHVKGYILDDEEDITELRNLLEWRMGESFRRCNDAAFGGEWLLQREPQDGTWSFGEYEDEDSMPLEPDIEFMEKSFQEYVRLMQGFYEATLDESLVVQAEHPYLDRIQRLTYGTRAGCWIRACFEGHARDMIELCTRLKREEEAAKAGSEEKDSVELAIDEPMSGDGEIDRPDDGDKDSIELAREADELIASTADTNERASQLRAWTDALLATEARR